jgi:hypothetical protein
MLVLEFKAYGKACQFQSVDQAIRTVQFIRNKSIRLWMDGQARSWVELSRYCALLSPLTMQLGISSACGWSISAKCFLKSQLLFLLPELPRNALSVMQLSKSL